MYIDLSKSALENAFDLINASNGSRFSSEYLYLNEPKYLPGANPNTMILATPVANKKLKGSVAIQYNRLSIKDERKRVSTVTLKRYETPEQTTRRIALELGLLPDEISLNKYELEEQPSLMTVYANRESLVYAPGNTAINVIWQSPAAITDLVVQTELNGYQYYPESLKVDIGGDIQSAIAEMHLVPLSSVQVFLEDETYDPYGDTVVRYQLSGQQFPNAIKITRTDTVVDIATFLPVSSIPGFYSSNS